MNPIRFFTELIFWAELRTKKTNLQDEYLYVGQRCTPSSEEYPYRHKKYSLRDLIDIFCKEQNIVRLTYNDLEAFQAFRNVSSSKEEMLTRVQVYLDLHKMDPTLAQKIVESYYNGNPFPFINF